ncbi:LysR substrate-binding domain-containing protein [Accumulibacter sp.]|uniref:LysR substrate-binding domain-containing protein n=1 Tax=Accumulibacter sp. TaxID=2053492 RepID=UPI00261D44A5|nr:LysR substrate-binding domain-containing protein [Accumulibacter sp.]
MARQLPPQLRDLDMQHLIALGDLRLGKARRDVLRAVPVESLDGDHHRALDTGAIVGFLQTCDQRRIIGFVDQPCASPDLQPPPLGVVHQDQRDATVGDLAGEPCVSFSGLVPSGEWEIRDGGKTLRVPVNTVLSTNQIDAAVQACTLGLGWGQFFDYHVRDELHAGTLLEVLAEQHGQHTPAHIVYPQARLLSPNVRAFIDFAAPKLRLALAAGA